LRSEFPKLWEFIETQTLLLKDETTWQTENTLNGMCGYYSSGDGSTTFRLMNLNGSMIKAVDGITQLVGRYQEDENKKHLHNLKDESSVWNHTANLLGTDNAVQFAKTQEGSATSSIFPNSSFSGGAENTVKNIGALPLIISK
jgi:microcystin-dependent protein